MFRANNYYIIENKEDFLENWDKNWERLANAVMPNNFDLAKAKFPLALYRVESWQPQFCDNFSYASMEKAIEEITKAYDEEIEYFTDRKKRLKNLQIPLDK